MTFPANRKSAPTGLRSMNTSLTRLVKASAGRSAGGSRATWHLPLSCVPSSGVLCAQQRCAQLSTDAYPKLFAAMPGRGGNGVASRKQAEQAYSSRAARDEQRQLNEKQSGRAQQEPTAQAGESERMQTGGPSYKGTVHTAGRSRAAAQHPRPTRCPRPARFASPAHARPRLVHSLRIKVGLGVLYHQIGLRGLLPAAAGAAAAAAAVSHGRWSTEAEGLPRPTRAGGAPPGSRWGRRHPSPGLSS